MAVPESVPTRINDGGIMPPRVQTYDLLNPPPGAVLWMGWLGATMLGGLAYMGIVKLLTTLVRGLSSPLTEWPGGSLIAISTAILAQWVLLRLYVGRVGTGGLAHAGVARGPGYAAGRGVGLSYQPSPNEGRGTVTSSAGAASCRNLIGDSQ
jgi:hypothetical protein